MPLLSLCVILVVTAAPDAGAEQPSGDEQIQVTVGRPVTLSASTGHYNFPTLQQIGPQHLFVKIWASPDAALGEKDIHEVGQWTEDGGGTWGKRVSFRGKEAGGHSWIRRKDGTCVWLSYFTRPIAEKQVSCNLGHSSDGRTYSWSAGKVTFPKAVKPWRAGNAYMVFARSILEMTDNSLLATMYGRFAEDKFDRSILVRSTDGGKTWGYYSTIARDERIGHLDEPVLVRLASGELFCVMRNRSGVPMYSTRSKDHGRTFSPPRRLPAYAASVFPDMVLMSNGILALSFGRPGTHLMFAVDGKGRRWTSRTTIHAGTNTDAYTAIREVAPGRLLYIYQETMEAPDGKRENAIRGVFVDVTRK